MTRDEAMRIAHRSIGGIGDAAEEIEDTRDDSIRWIARALRLLQGLGLQLLREWEMRQ